MLSRISRLFIFLPVAFIAVFHNPASAETGSDQWSVEQSCSSGSFQALNGELILVGPDNAGAPDCFGQNFISAFTIVENTDSLSFNWQFTTSDDAYYDPPKYAVDGEEFLLLPSGKNGSGVVTINKQGILVLKFIQMSKDSCCGAGILKITNMSFNPIVVDTTTSTVESTTTTEETTTTISETTTTVPETTTTIVSTTVPVVQTTVAPSTTVKPTTTTSSSTTVPMTTTTETPIEEIFQSEIDPSVAADLSSSEEFLASLDGDQASELFESIDISSLSEEEANAIVEAVQSAPEEVRESFEDAIDIFSGGFDSYKPLGSAISVQERRVLVAVGAAMAAMPSATQASGSSRNRAK